MNLLRNCIVRLELEASGLLARSRREEGQTLVEYALILSLIAIVVAAVLVTLSSRIESVFNTVSSSL